MFSSFQLALPRRHSWSSDGVHNAPARAGGIVCQGLDACAVVGLSRGVRFRDSLSRNVRLRAGLVQDGDLAGVEVAPEPNIPCENCKGRGWLLCDYCEGQKVNVRSRNNRIYRRCPSCRAVGVVICPRCKVFKCISFSDEKAA